VALLGRKNDRRECRTRTAKEKLMSTARERLKHKLKITAGLPPWGLTDDELDLIIREMADISKQRTPTWVDWQIAARRYVRGAGLFKYSGEDLSDLNALLMMILATPTPATGSQSNKSL
jgi:hypothetical protein